MCNYNVAQSICFSLVLSLVTSHVSAQQQDYDESVDIAALANHATPAMRFQRLSSRELDKNSLWAPFQIELQSFSAEQYEAMKPLVLDQNVASMQDSIAQGRLTYELLVTFYLFRIREIESDSGRFINGVISLNPEAISRARSLDEQRAANITAEFSPIFGMPVLLKDNIGFAGLATTAGAMALHANMAADAFITERLQEQGAIILGKANLSEWAYFFCQGCPSGYSALGGQTLNPYGRFEFSTGGSSAGSAASIAANFAALSVGSETSGSILSPASANSLVGLKPTTGNLSRSGVVPISSTLDTAGPITRSVADAVILFNAMAGYDRNDMAMPLIADDFRLQYRLVELTGKRVGTITSFDDEAEYRAAAELLSEAGAELLNLEFNPERDERFIALLGGEMVRDLAIYLRDNGAAAVPISSIAELQAYNLQDMDARAPYGQGLVDIMVELGLSESELELIRSELQSTATTQLDQLFNQNNLQVLLTINNSYAAIAALANYPAMTIPMAYDENGRPIGLTLIAPPFREQDLVDIGARFESLTQARRAPSNYP